MKRLLYSLLLLAIGSFLLVSCVKDDPIDYDSSLLIGKWQRANSNEYWLYKSDGSGEFWDEDDDVHQGEGTQMRWSLSVDELKLTFVGQMGMEVPHYYKIKQLDAFKLCLNEEEYNSSTTYYRINES